MKIPLIIANQSSVRDDEAISLTREIYHGLLRERQVEHLLNSARIRLGTDWWKPVIFTPLKERRLPEFIKVEIKGKKRGFIGIGDLDIESVSAFVYRFEPIRRLGELLSKDSKVLVMHGIGGAGKSVLASYAARFYKGRFDIVIFLNVEGIKTPRELIDMAADKLLKDGFINDEDIIRLGKVADPVRRWRRLYQSLPNASLLLILDNLEIAQEKDGRIKQENGWHEFVGELIAEDGFRGKLLITTRIIPVKDSLRWTREENIIEIGEYEYMELIQYINRIQGELNVKLPQGLPDFLEYIGGHPLGLYTLMKFVKEMGQEGFHLGDILDEVSDRFRFYDDYLDIRTLLPPYPVSAGFMRKLSGSTGFRLMHEALRIFKKIEMGEINYLSPYPILRTYGLMKMKGDEKQRLISEVMEEMKQHEPEGLYYFLNLGYMASELGDEDTALEALPVLSAEGWGGIMIDERLKVLEKIRLSLQTEDKLSAALNQVGMVYWQKGELDRALEYLKKAKEICERRQDEGGLASTFHEIGIVYQGKGELGRALEYFEKAREINERREDGGSLADNLYHIGIVYQGKGELDRALEYLEKVMDIFEGRRDEWRLAGTLHQIGSVYQQKGDLDRALGYLEKAKEIFERRRDEGRLAITLSKIGMAYLYKGKLDRTLEYFEKAKEIFERRQDEGRLAMTLGQIAIVYQQKDELDRALGYLEKAREINERHEDEGSLAITLHQIGRVYLQKGELDRALEYFEKARAIFERRQDEGRLASTLGQIGMMYQDKGELQRSLEYLEKALERFKNTDNIGIDSLLTTYNNIINVLLEAKSPEAERYIIDALSIEKQVLSYLAPEIVIPRVLETLRYALMIKDSTKDKPTLEGLLSSTDFRRLMAYLEEDSGI